MCGIDREERGMAAGHGTERVVRMVVVYEPGNRGAEEGRMIENEAFWGQFAFEEKATGAGLRRLRAGFAWAWHRTYRSAEREMTMIVEGAG